MSESDAGTGSMWITNEPFPVKLYKVSGEVAPPVLSGAVPEAFAAGDGGDVLGQMFAQSGSTSGADVVSL